MYRSLLITSVDDSVSAVTALLGAGFTGLAGLACFTGLPPQLPE